MEISVSVRFPSIDRSRDVFRIKRRRKKKQLQKITHTFPPPLYPQFYIFAPIRSIATNRLIQMTNLILVPDLEVL